VRWIVGFGADIYVNWQQLQARSEYIKTVSQAEVSAWSFISINGKTSNRFLHCISDDGVDGTFITAHKNDTYELCMLKQISNGELVIANTCIWQRLSHKNLLLHMMTVNRTVELWFAKQELSIDNQHTFRQSTTLLNVGRFGFQTSLSERELFKQRHKGLKRAISEAFVRVSPIIMIGE